MNISFWYQSLEKPFFAPPAEVFGIVWSILYPIIFISFGYVFYLILKDRIPSKVSIPFIVNLVANFSFSPIQFGLQNNILAMIDILIVFGSLIWAMKVIWKYSRGVAIAQIPYLLWVGFAMILQISITWLNFK
ncbi:tryptophan-rich sensory protein [Candidatus Gracilibacteria bacterium]|nr:tryptophan-rich sensory protein [Candidatus Gracilibacteria bacterium]